MSVLETIYISYKSELLVGRKEGIKEERNERKEGGRKQRRKEIQKLVVSFARLGGLGQYTNHKNSDLPIRHSSPSWVTYQSLLLLRPQVANLTLSSLKCDVTSLPTSVVAGNHLSSFPSLFLSASFHYPTFNSHILPSILVALTQKSISDHLNFDVSLECL